MASTKKIFQIGSQQVRIRTDPNLRAATVGWLDPNTHLEVEAASRQEVGDYVWWQHASGWSAERSINGKYIFMLEVAPEEVPEPTPVEETPAPTKKIFVVGGQQVRVRSDSSLRGTLVKWLDPGTRLECDINSRQEVGNYVWWQHADGWTAERSINGKELYLFEPAPEEVPITITTTTTVTTPTTSTTTTVTTTAGADSDPTPTVTTTSTTADSDSDATPTTAVTKFQVGNQEVRVRADVGLRGAMVKWLTIGSIIEVDPTSRTEKDNYVWWKHADGWSAERSSDNSSIFLFEPGSIPVTTPISNSGVPTNENLPMLDSLFKRFPVDLDKTRWWQYYGNNVFAYNLWRDGKKWYAYAQGIHGGLDFGNSSAPGIPVYAGIENGTFLKLDTRYTQPNGLWVRVGDYIIIYGHLTNPRAFNVGDPIGVDTVMGEIQYGGQNHLHLEVRYKERWIVNPLLLMSPAMRDQITGKFAPGPKYFYSDAGWNQWQTPLDQPVLVLGGSLIGPHAPR